MCWTNKRMREASFHLVEHPYPRHPELNERKDQDDEKQYPRQQGSIAHPQVLERMSVDKEHVEERCVYRTALRGDVSSGKYLERADDTHHQIEEDERRNQMSPVPINAFARPSTDRV